MSKKPRIKGLHGLNQPAERPDADLGCWLQREAAEADYRPLAGTGGESRRWRDGDTADAAGGFATCCRSRRTESLGLFSTPGEAHEAWRKRKHEIAQLVAATESDPRIVEALKKRYSFEERYK